MDDDDEALGDILRAYAQQKKRTDVILERLGREHGIVFRCQLPVNAADCAVVVELPCSEGLTSLIYVDVHCHWLDLLASKSKT